MRKFLFLVLILLAVPGKAQTPGNGKAWRYQLLEGSAVMDECLICGRPTFWVPLNGSFDLVGTTNTQILQITNFNFRSDYTASPEYQIMKGTGVLDRSKGMPELTAEVEVRHLDTLETIQLTNEPPDASRIFPMLSVIAGETPSTLLRKYHLQIKAAPIQEVWFFTSETNVDLERGDLRSNTGRVVKQNRELTEKMSLLDLESEILFDAVDVGPRGEVFLSTVTNQESIVSGPIGHGDVVTSAGRLYLQNAQLLSAFGVDDPDAGLDAIHIISEDEFYFSISKEVSRPTGGLLRRGDVLSNKGRIIRTEAALLLRYQNPLTNSVGIDALYVWPNGEIWFSTETNFDSVLGPIDAGDLLSDQGYIVFRNADLIGSFRPHPPASAGLRDITVVSDAAANTSPVQLLEISVTPEGVDLRWDGAARVFRPEKAETVEGPYRPLDFTPDRSLHDGVLGGSAFYRVRQW